MKNIKYIVGKVMTAATLLLLIGCDNGGDCNINNVAYNRVVFYSIDPDTGIEKATPYNNPITVSLVVNGKDSIVVNYLSQAEHLDLPMSFTADCDTILIRDEEVNITDTLFVSHTNIPYFVSMDCGTAMYHDITGVRCTDQMLDSAVIVSPSSTYDIHENIKLYINN